MSIVDLERSAQEAKKLAVLLGVRPEASGEAEPLGLQIGIATILGRDVQVAVVVEAAGVAAVEQVPLWHRAREGSLGGK